MSPEVEQLQENRNLLLKRIESLAPFRPGSLVENYRKCGRPTCHCAREGDKGHGPQWLITRSIKGKTVSKKIQSAHLKSAREQIARFHHFQELMHEYIETNVKICDHLLQTAESDQPPVGEKGGSKM